MTQQELLKIAAKIKDGTATEEDKSQFFGGLNEILEEMASVLGESNAQF